MRAPFNESVGLASASHSAPNADDVWICELLSAARTPWTPSGFREMRGVAVDDDRKVLPPLQPVAETMASISQARSVISTTLGRTAQVELLEHLADDDLLAFIRADSSPIPTPQNQQGYCGDNHLAYWLFGLGEC